MQKRRVSDRCRVKDRGREKRREFLLEKEKWESEESFGKTVTSAVVASIVEQWTGIPAGKMLQSEREAP